MFPVIMTRYKSPVCGGCLPSITEYLVSGGDQIIAVFFIPPPPPPSPRTQHPIISKSRGIFANLILIFQIFLLTNEQGLRHLVSINTLTSTHITSRPDKLILKLCFYPTTQRNYWRGAVSESARGKIVNIVI